MVTEVPTEKWEKDAIHHLHVFACLFRDKITERYYLAQQEYLSFISALLATARAEERERIEKIVEGMREEQPSNVEHPYYEKGVADWTIKDDTLSDLLTAINPK